MALEVTKVTSSSSLLNLPSSEEYKDLVKTQQDKFLEAVQNLVNAYTPRDVVYKRPIRGGSQADYVPGWWFIEQLNALFAYNWDYEIITHGFYPATGAPLQVWVQGKLTVRLDGITITKTSFGSSDVKKTRDNQAVIDIGDDLKAAATDSLKKAATLLGIASDIYGRREVNESTAPGSEQMSNLYRIGEKAGMSKEQVDTWIKEQTGKVPKELEAVIILGLIPKLRAKVPKS